MFDCFQFEPFIIAGDHGELPIAIHEAGHCVCHHGLGTRIAGASIDQEQGITGATAFVTLEPPGQTVLTLSIIATAAGPAATFRLFGLPFHLEQAELSDAFARHGGSDAASLARAAQHLEQVHPGTTAELHFRHALAHAAELIARPAIWLAVMDLAALLIRRRAEYGAAIHEHLERHMPFGSLVTHFMESHYGQTTDR